MIRRHRLTEEARLLVQKALSLRPHSYAELEAITGLKHSVVAKHIRTLREFKIAHVGDWGRDGDLGTRYPLFAWGDKPDVPRPPALTAAQRMAKSRANKEKS
jgi:DNA-binding transcriptional ArsR family regulator